MSAACQQNSKARAVNSISSGTPALSRRAPSSAQSFGRYSRYRCHTRRSIRRDPGRRVGLCRSARRQTPGASRAILMGKICRLFAAGLTGLQFVPWAPQAQTKAQRLILTALSVMESIGGGRLVIARPRGRFITLGADAPTPRPRQTAVQRWPG
jgi:hypothetical protein